MKIEKVLLTPAKAKQLLERNTNNRNLSEAKVFAYAKEMKSDNWMQDTGEMIKISKDGRILDGQHRLHALIKADVMMSFHIASELDNKVFRVIDTGKARNSADILKIAGVKNASQIASTISLFNNMYNNKSNAEKATNYQSLRPQEILDMYNEEPEYWQEVITFSHNMYNKLQKIWSKTEIGVYTALLDNISILKSREFIRQVCEGTDISNDVVILLRNKLISDKLNTKSKLPVSHRRALIIKSWNTFYNNDHRKILKFTPELEKYPELDGLN